MTDFHQVKHEKASVEVEAKSSDCKVHFTFPQHSSHANNAELHQFSSVSSRQVMTHWLFLHSEVQLIHIRQYHHVICHDAGI